MTSLLDRSDDIEAEHLNRDIEYVNLSCRSSIFLYLLLINKQIKNEIPGIIIFIAVHSFLNKIADVCLQ